MNANLFPGVGEEIGRWKLIRFRQATPTPDYSTRWYDVRHRETGKLGFCEVEIVAGNPFVNTLVHLPQEAMIVKETTHLGLCTFQRFIEYGEAPDGNYVYLITDALGPTLESLRFSLPPIAQNRFTLATSLYISQKMLFGLQELHEAGYLHRSIKDERFALNRSMNSEIVVIGAVLMRRWMKWDGSGGALPARITAPFRGSLKYSSANALRQNEQHRLDDLWSWFYLIVDLTVGSLPWTNLTVNGDIYDHLRVYADAKEAASQETMWLDSAPPEYKEILKYLNTTPSNAEPDYNRLTKVLRRALKRTVDENGGRSNLDWEPEGAYYDELRSLLPDDEQ